MTLSKASNKCRRARRIIKEDIWQKNRKPSIQMRWSSLTNSMICSSYTSSPCS